MKNSWDYDQTFDQTCEVESTANIVDATSSALHEETGKGDIKGVYDLTDFGILLSATICCKDNGVSKKEIIESFQTDWGVDVDGIAKRIGYPGLEQFLQHEQIQKYVEAFPINDGDSIVYRAKSLSQNKHILIGIKENKLREEERDHKESMQKYAELGKPENREAFIEGKRRILTILMELNAHLESVSFQAVQNEYLKRYKVFLNSSEQLRLFHHKSAFKNFKRAFFEEVSVEAENPLCIQLRSGDIKLPVEMTEEDRARVAKVISQQSYNGKDTRAPASTRHKKSKLSRADEAGVYTDSEEESGSVKSKSKSVPMSLMETNLRVQTNMNALTSGNMDVETRNKVIFSTKPKYLTIDEPGVYSDSDKESFGDNSGSEEVKMDSTKELSGIGQNNVLKDSDTTSCSIGDVILASGSHSADESPERWKHSDDYILSSSEEKDCRPTTCDKIDKDQLQPDFPYSSLDQVPASANNSFPDASRHTISTQTDSDRLHVVSKQMGISSATCDSWKPVSLCINCRQQFSVGAESKDTSEAAHLSKVQKLAHTIEIIMDRRSPQPLLLSELPKLIGSIYGNIIDPLHDPDCKLSWNDLISQYCSSLHITRLPNKQEIIFLMEKH